MFLHLFIHLNLQKCKHITGRQTLLILYVVILKATTTKHN